MFPRPPGLHGVLAVAAAADGEHKLEQGLRLGVAIEGHLLRENAALLLVPLMH